MIIPVRFYKLKRILNEQWTLFVSIFVFFLLIIVVLVFYGQFNEQKKEVDLMTGEVQMLKNRFDTLKYNKSLTEDQIKDYNKLLASLVPETEDFFSIVYALEQISLASKFIISDYVIEIGKLSNRERITLNVTGKGDTEAFLRFLQEYQFAGGRLATSDKIQYGGTTTGGTKIALTFYNKRFTFNESVQVPQLSKEEIAKLEVIKQKVKFQFSSSGYQSISTEYPEKGNPFTAGDTTSTDTTNVSN
ncbi:MAG: hypothetical protein NTV98_04955 [Candidatus Roizmanbacteria bacterium]|nr:hypothetical protein [Candidatus Roizmanbacteria bacterium]